ncbi:disease resistance protein RGA2-like [Musa acuminata AAA Group]|uniref:disease resistance protein RGA2-like n=1 Tax=Musa acuminata AAA Group TaxID=214697 RepID=UPI0031D0D8E0
MESVDPRQKEEYSTVLREEVVGRNEDVEKIIDILQQQQSGDCVEWLLIEGGDGRKTLGRLIYHHSWVHDHFQHRIWVDVPSIASLDPMWIMREFTRSITGEPCEDIWLFYDGVHESKYFLVLDDLNVEEEDKDKWLQLENFLLLVGAPGSTAVVIPDLHFSDHKLGSAIRPYPLEYLSEDAWVELCMRQALIRPDQQEEANTIRQFCRTDYDSIYGTPAGAKMYGSVFRYTEMNRWQQQISGLDTNFIRIHYMPRKWTRLMLYHWLIVQDDMANYKDFFHVLAAEGLLLFSSDEDEVMIREYVRTLDLDFSFAATEHCYFLTEVDSNSTIPQQCLYLRMLVDSNTITFPTILSDGVNNLRDLVLQQKEMDLQYKYHILHIPKGIFTNLIHLRILHLRAIKVQQLPDTVDKLLILRYLNLAQSEIQALPKSLCKLRNLQILNLAHCEKLQNLPRQIHNLENLHVLKLTYCTKLQMLPISVTGLVNLQELDLEGCQWLVELPEGLSNMRKLTNLNIYGCPLNQMLHKISQISNLLKLSGYIIIGDIGNAFSELQSLINLKELWLQNLEQVSNSEDTSTSLKLYDILPQLIYLKLHWKWNNMVDMRTSKPVWLQVLERLQPNSNLKKLEIILYADEEFPVWIKEGFYYLHRLKEIKLINLKRCKMLPSLGQLLSLEIIEISGMDLINIIDETFYGDNGTFPELRELTFSHMPALEKWLKVGREEFLFSELYELTLIQCPKFKALEVHLRVSRLSIWLNNKMLQTSELKGWHNLQHIRDLEIVGCQELRCLPRDMERCVKLDSLRIIGCENLDFLPEWLQGFNLLNSLFIYGCRALSSMPEELKLLPVVDVKGCPKLRL